MSISLVSLGFQETLSKENSKNMVICMIVLYLMEVHTWKVWVKCALHMTNSKFNGIEIIIGTIPQYQK